MRSADCASGWSVVIRLRRGPGGFSGIDQIAELFRWLEVRNALGRDFYSLAGLWIAANAGIALANAKRAKAADFDFVAALQRRDHGIKYGLHDDLAIAACQVAQSRDLFHQICLRHVLWPPYHRINAFYT